MKPSPFEPTILEAIFKFDPDKQERLASRESGRLEFKEAFNLGNADDYAKTMAAFSNTAGGYLVFGVKDSPRTLIALKSENFETLDPARVTVVLYTGNNRRFDIKTLHSGHPRSTVPVTCYLLRCLAI